MFDSFYDLAKNKTICEDFAYCDPSFYFGALSDGCSSGKDCHIAAGLIAKIGPDFIDQVKRDYYTRDVYFHIFDFFSFDNILATQLTIDRHNKKITVSGDGTVVVKKDNLYKIINYSYPKNAPYYLAYKLYPKYEKEYLDQFDNGKKVVRVMFLDENLAIKNCSYYDSYNLIEEVNIEGSDLSLIFSDGIESYRKESGEELSYLDFIREILKFKNFNGKFLKRRYNAVKKLFNNMGFYNYDDVSGVALITNGNP